MDKKPPHPYKFAINVCIGVFVGTVLLRACDESMEQKRAENASTLFIQGMTEAVHNGNAGLQPPPKTASQAEADALHIQIQATLKKAREARGETN